MNTTITIQHSKTSKTGYEIVDNGKIISIDSTYPGEPLSLVLPANSANRHYFNKKKVDNAGGKIEVSYKETKHFGPRGSSNRQPSKPLEYYLEGDEREAYVKLVEKAKKIKQETTKLVPLTVLEKAQRNAERAKEKLEKLMKEAEARQKVEATKTQRKASKETKTTQE